MKDLSSLVEQTRPCIKALYEPVHSDAKTYQALDSIKAELAELTVAISDYEEAKFRSKDTSNARGKVSSSREGIMRTAGKALATLQHVVMNEQRKEKAVRFVTGVMNIAPNATSLGDLSYALYLTSTVCDCYAVVLDENNWEDINNLKSVFDSCDKNRPKKPEYGAKSADVEAARKAVQDMQGIQQEASILEGKKRTTYSEAWNNVGLFMWNLENFSLKWRS